ncbi:DUF2922 domain-containing protein [Bacillus sp. FJAT-22090]|uniref:DUF2922 domain-containing protein n=1 Tax=Bacillus sp. FJAT-22090 TaxID=1581038 RepID=UPI00119F7D67|nr:DUF2922 domain-containing protein [Bacillus sp. FJAT-22090]
MSKVLQLQFEAANGKNFMLTVDDPKESLTPQEVETGMQAIINSNVFHVDAIPLTVVKSAKVMERNVTTII